MKQSMKLVRPAVLSFVVMTLLCGVLYTAAVTGVAQLAFPRQANGSVITVKQNDGTTKEYGSALIAQKFTKPQYLIGRPDGVSNLSPTSAAQKVLVQKRVDGWHSLDPQNAAVIPEDLVTASGSGVDPHITPAAAAYQVSRIAKVRGISEDTVRNVIQKYTETPLLGVFGEPAVNVLEVNLALDGLLPQ